MNRYRLMMRFRKMLFAAMLVSCAALGTSQPVSCIEDGECREGYFCETSVYVCHECLSCEDLKREPLRSPQACIKSIRECGPCLKGLVEDRQGDLNCMLPTDGVSTGDGNTVAWVVSGIIIALIFVVAVAVVFIKYICRNSFIKFNVDTNIDATLPRHVVATAPESPPPYSPAHQNKDPPQPDESAEETSHPLIKPYQPPYPAYEAQDYQNVTMYNPPAYVRLNGLHPAKVYNDVNDNYSPAEHEEDTTPSAWVPGRGNGDTTADPAVNEATTPSTQPHLESNESAGDFSTALAIARNTDLIQQPPVTLHMQRIGNNEEDNADDDNGDARAHHNTAGGGASAHNARNGNNNYNVMNVNQIITIIKPPL